MAVDTTALDRALGAIGTTFRLTRLYPATHPAMQEALRQVTAALPGVAALGMVEWNVGATGLHWQHQQLLPRNTQLAELAGLLYSRGVRVVTVNPGVTAEHILALFGVATGGVPPDDPALGRVTVSVGRTGSVRLSAAVRPPDLVAATPPAPPAPPAPLAPPVPAGSSASASPPSPASPAPLAPPSPTLAEGKRGVVFRPDVLPADVEVRRTLEALQAAETTESQRAAAEKLLTLAPYLMTQRDVAAIAEVIVALDAVLPKVQDGSVAEQIGAVGTALADGPTVERMVKRLGELRVPPGERAAIVKAVGALAAVTAAQVVDAYLGAPPELREPYRAAIRVAADRAFEPLQGRLEGKREDVVAATAHLLGLTGSPQAVPLLIPLIRHRADAVREAALHALAEIGGREVTRPAMPALKDESAAVRAAAAQVIGGGGDPGATTVLVRRLEQEADEGVLAELLKAVGRLAAPQALEVLARYAEPGGRLRRRTPHLRAAAIEGLGYLNKGEARGLLELYSHDKEPSVRRAAEAALR